VTPALTTEAPTKNTGSQTLAKKEEENNGKTM
jgi:hypothetical protein